MVRGLVEEGSIFNVQQYFLLLFLDRENASWVRQLEFYKGCDFGISRIPVQYHQSQVPPQST